VHRLVEAQGIPVRLGHRCVSMTHDGDRIRSVVLECLGNHLEARVDGVLSSIPLGQLVLNLDPVPPEAVLEAATRLRHRSMCVVALMTDEEEPFPDNWIYLQDADTRAGCVQNFRAWSRDMVQPGGTCLGVEYFCSPDDDIWHMDDAAAVELAKRELGRIGLIDPARVFDGVKIRVPQAYPIYDAGYVEAIAIIRGYLERFSNLQTFGRNGLHRYNNQDHSMWTAMMATANLLDGASHDVWALDTQDPSLEDSTLTAPPARDVPVGA
jgi:protoporphyrinogen oxidase